MDEFTKVELNTVKHLIDVIDRNVERGRYSGVNQVQFPTVQSYKTDYNVSVKVEKYIKEHYKDLSIRFLRLCSSCQEESCRCSSGTTVWIVAIWK